MDDEAEHHRDEGLGDDLPEPREASEGCASSGMAGLRPALSEKVSGQIRVDGYDVLVRLNELIECFANHRGALDRLGIRGLLVFGSVARDEARPDSDVDLIADFDRPIGYLGLVRAQREFEELLGCRVDLATREMIREELRDQIYREAIRAA